MKTAHCRRCNLDVPVEETDILEDHGLLAGQQGQKGKDGRYKKWTEATHRLRPSDHEDNP